MFSTPLLHFCTSALMHLCKSALLRFCDRARPFALQLIRPLRIYHSRTPIRTHWRTCSLERSITASTDHAHYAALYPELVFVPHRTRRHSCQVVLHLLDSFAFPHSTTRVRHHFHTHTKQRTHP